MFHAEQINIKMDYAKSLLIKDKKERESFLKAWRLNIKGLENDPSNKAVTRRVVNQINSLDRAIKKLT